MGRPGVMLYFDVLPALDALPKAAAGELLTKALHYAQDGLDPVFDDPALVFAWSFLKTSIDRDGVAYDTKRARGDWLVYCRSCKRDGEAPLDFETWRERSVDVSLRCIDVSSPTTSSTTTTTTSSTTTTTSASTSTQNQIEGGADKPPAPPRNKKFVPPTLGEVAAYVKERGSRVDPQGFLDFYESKGWLVGRSPMRDWKAACRRAEGWECWNKGTADKNRIRDESEYLSDDNFLEGK